MPNWCNNSITIQGQTETIKTFWNNASATGSGLLNAMVPQPQFANSFYEWNVNNWGTKWDVVLEGLEFTDNDDGTASITGWFDSAWSPPIEAYETFCNSMDGVFLEAYYQESGMCFIGYWNSEGEDDHYEYDNATSENVRDIIPGYLVDHYELDQQLAEWEEMAN